MDIPNTLTWQPEDGNHAWLKRAFIEQCIYSEDAIIARLHLEKRTNLNTFDHGIPLEEFVLNEFSKLFPKRYTLLNGTISDSQGKTAGDCDFIIFNDHWFPHVISGATPKSRKKILPIDGVYSIGEIKSNLNEQTLDAACRKLVVASRLKRNYTNNERLVENRDSGCIHGLTNPLYTFILAAGINNELEFESLINRFFDINKQLKRLEMIRALCVLGKGVVIWGYTDNQSNQTRPALFMNDDLYMPIYPIYIPYAHNISTVYPFMTNLHLHLFHSVLAPEDFSLYYGNGDLEIKIPNSVDVVLPPDSEWLDKLSTDCIKKHNFQ